LTSASFPLLLSSPSPLFLLSPSDKTSHYYDLIVHIRSPPTPPTFALTLATCCHENHVRYVCLNHLKNPKKRNTRSEEH
jgi:hypothetical protein